MEKNLGAPPGGARKLELHDGTTRPPCKYSILKSYAFFFLLLKNNLIYKFLGAAQYKQYIHLNGAFLFYKELFHGYIFYFFY